MESLTVAYTIKTATLLGLSTTQAPQGRWLIDDRKPKRSVFYWDGPELAKPDPPATLVELIDGRELPRPFKIASLTSGKPSRGVALLYEYGDWLGRVRDSSTSRAPSDNYNPFGRFSTGVSSFLPAQSLGKESGDTTLANLASKDKSFKKIVGFPNDVERSPYGSPMEVIVEGGQVLELVQDTPFGAAYAEDPGSGGVAAYDHRLAGPILTTLPPPSEPVKQARNFQITPTEIKAWTGQDRSVAQGVVMGASAGDVAENAGFARNEGAGWEWLHLIAHSMGGIETEGPQVADNLVAGTSECNTQMIVVEEFIKDYAIKWDGRVVLVVQAKMFDAERHIGQFIVYDAEFHNEADEPVEVFHWVFDALSRRNPMTVENRLMRTAGREALEGGGDKATDHQPRSQPTAHEPYVAPEDEPVAQLGQEVVAAMNGRSPEQFAAWLAEKRQARPNGRLPGAIFDDIADKLTVENARAYCTAIATQISSQAAARVLSGVNIELRLVVGRAMDDGETQRVGQILGQAVQHLGDMLEPAIFNVVGEKATPETIDAWSEVVGKQFGPLAKNRLDNSFVRETVIKAMQSGKGETVMQVLKQAHDQLAERLDASVLDAIGMRATPTDIAAYCEAIGKLFGPLAAERVQTTYLLAQQRAQSK
jgi:hypothetical protein